MRHPWVAMALCLAPVIAVPRQWSVPSIPSPLAFQSLSGVRYSQLRRQAVQFVKAQPRQGFQLVERHADGAFRIHCRDVPVLWLDRRSQHLLLRVSLDAKHRAPDVLQLRALLQRQMHPLDYLEQVLAGVPEPVLMDRVRWILAGGCPMGRDVARNSRAWLDSKEGMLRSTRSVQTPLSRTTPRSPPTRHLPAPSSAPHPPPGPRHRAGSPRPESPRRTGSASAARARQTCA